MILSSSSCTRGYHCSLAAQKTHSEEVMAMVAGFIRDVYPDSRYGKTNLQEYLEAATGSR